MAVRSWLGVACALLTFADAAPASAQPRELRVAVYAPWSGPPTADERFAFALQLETALAEAELGPAKVASYAKARDFERAVTSGKVDLALVDAAAAAALPKRLAVVASWSSRERWVLAGASALPTLRGKRLALQAADAASSSRLIGRLLRGQVAPGYWSRVVGAPVTADARQLVLRGLADIVAVPQRLVGELTELVNLGSFTELALATADADAEPRLAAAGVVIRTVVRDAFGGDWTDGAPRFPAAVGPTRLVAAPVPTTAPKLLDLLAPAAGAVPELPLDEMWLEPNAP